MCKSIVDLVKSSETALYGVDTETYRDGEFRGLKSIQVWSPSESHYFTSDDFTKDDDAIRNEVSGRFIEWIDTLDKHTILGFFNLNFDLSQFLHYLICDSGYEYVESSELESYNLRKSQINILEANTKVYKVQLRTPKGYNVWMLDIANFLTDTTLDGACKEWIGQGKIELESKKFPKRASSPIEIEYAMKDAELTYRLFEKLEQSEVIEGHKFATIAGRTMGHYKHYLKEQFGLTFSEWVYGTKDEDIVKEYNLRNEELMRDSIRGGYVYAFQHGIFEGCHHIDARSMYPTQCVKPYIPWGPIESEEPNENHTILHFVTGFFKLKVNRVAYFQFRKRSQCARYHYINDYDAGDMVADCYLDGSYMLWDEELEYIKDAYDCDILDDKKYYIRMRANTVLKPYVEYLYKGKMNNTGTKRYYYKILLNALYGKFLTRPDGDIISYKGKERHRLETNDKRLYYLPLGSWIAMRGRITLVTAMSSIPYDNLLYCDTDSIIYKGDVQPDVTIGKWLGDWGYENDNFSANIIGPKTYQEQNDQLITKCAGLGKDVIRTVKFGELKEGAVFHTLKSVRNPENWSISLEEREHEVKPRAFTFRRGLI